METCRVLFIECLHIGYLQDSFIIIFDLCITHRCPALFHSPLNCVHIDNVVTDLRHQFDQDHFIQAREYLRIHYVANFQLHESLRKLQLIFHSLCNF